MLGSIDRIQAAGVTLNGRGRTCPDGVAILPGALGHVDVRVSKEGFFPAHASVDVDASKESTVQIELQPRRERQEEVTVYATRNDVRVQDSPLHVEVVSQDFGARQK
jgi:PEGA domain-containing protein